MLLARLFAGTALWLALAGCGGSDHGQTAASSAFPGPGPGARTGTLEAVSDGDTIRLVGIGRVRLIGIDTPEIHGRVECFGQEASDFVSRFLAPGARVRYRTGREERDRYGRLLAYVWLPDDRFLNGLLVSGGYAQPLTIPPNVEFAHRFVAAARRARERKRGLWGRPGCA